MSDMIEADSDASAPWHAGCLLADLLDGVQALQDHLLLNRDGSPEDLERLVSVVTNLGERIRADALRLRLVEKNGEILTIGPALEHADHELGGYRERLTAAPVPEPAA